MSIYVEKRKNESIESMIKRFSRQIRKTGIMEEVHYIAFYLKPSLRKKYPKKKVW